MATPPPSLMPWSDVGRQLLEALNTPAQKRYLGGPETAAKLDDRHRRYLTYDRPGDTEMLMIVADGRIVGSIGYWTIERDGASAYEAGWEVLADSQGKGHGSAAARALVARLRPVARHRYVYAFPTPDNPGSNGICRGLGFVHLGIEDFEYPKGVVAPHAVWRLYLEAPGPRD